MTPLQHWVAEMKELGYEVAEANAPKVLTATFKLVNSEAEDALGTESAPLVSGTLTTVEAFATKWIEGKLKALEAAE